MLTILPDPDVTAPTAKKAKQPKPLRQTLPPPARKRKQQQHKSPAAGLGIVNCGHSAWEDRHRIETRDAKRWGTIRELRVLRSVAAYELGKNSRLVAFCLRAIIAEAAPGEVEDVRTAYRELPLADRARILRRLQPPVMP